MILFKDILSIDSTSGKERDMALWLHAHLDAPEKELQEVGDGTLNLFLRWGTPRVVFCTHMDTVPPYIPPVFWENKVCGRGSCDAKGQIYSMYTACKKLEAEGCNGFGLLILAGEETGSWGAKAFSKTGFKAPFLIVGEPTENKMVSASKGTKSYDLVFHGKAFHSGYPEHGVSAVERFIAFYNALKAVKFPVDPVLGETTWNVGLLRSDNPQNILSPELSCRLYFRTTFASDQAVCDYMAGVAEASPRGGDKPAKYVTLPGFESAPASFGTDAPHLTGFGHKIICGPGTVLVAHRDDEHILLADIDKAVEQYVKMFKAL
ncbi:MAG: M20/M25/M40 family metallo-hydrolase [Bacteroidales bacterium]|nr:M20/M25/M40 family metallo-hydrolase [Bacteroidales bacterium]